MKHVSVSRFFYLAMSFALLVAPLPLSAIVDEMVVPFFKIEADIITQNSDVSYIYFDQNFKRTISQLAHYDEDTNSPLHELDIHIKTGLSIGEYDDVIEVLQYAEHFLQENSELAQRQNIQDDFDAITYRVISGELIVNASNLQDFQDLAHKNIVVFPSSLGMFSQDASMDPDFITRDVVVETPPALVVATSDIGTPSGLPTIDGVTLVATNIVLLVGQSNPIQNGLWLAQAGAWTRPTNFATGNMPDQAYVLISSGSANAGSSWLCTTPTAVIDTDPISFVLFSYPEVLLGDVTGPLPATVVSFVGGQTAADVASATSTVQSAASANNANTLVQRTAAGNFSAGMISMTDAVISSTLKVTPFGAAGVVHNNSSGLLSSSLIVNADISSSAAIANSKLATLTTAGLVANAATTANSSNLANAIVARDISGNFSAGTITATLSGNATSATTATSATSATSFTGSLIGDVTGTQGATAVTFVGGQSATNVANATSTVQSATSQNNASAIVKRSASNGFSAGIISITDAVISNSLTITPFSTAGVLHNSVTTGAITSSLIVNADISSSAAIANSKLATLTTAGLVANSATTATSLNTANAIVARDGSGNVSASNFIGSLVGSASLNLLTAGGTMTGTLQLPAGTAAAPSLIFTGSTTAGLSATSGGLVFSTNALARMKISSGGIVSIPSLTTPGVLHNDSLGDFLSSLIVNSDISATAGIIDSKLATITSAGKVNNSATSANSLNVANAIVSRDTTGSFSAQEITMNDGILGGNLIFTTDPSTSTSGSIFKATNSFLHNCGTNDVFVGVNAGNFTTTGSNNSGFGVEALLSITTGTDNTALGYLALDACTTGSNNIAIGSDAGPSLMTGSGNIYINADAGSSSESNTTRIGTSQTACFIQGINGATTGLAGTAVLVDGRGQLGTISSRRAVKRDIEPLGDVSAKILDLDPVSFIYKDDATNRMQYGLIADDVDEILPEIVVHDEEGAPVTVQYHVLPVLLLNQMKKQHATIEQMNSIIVSLQLQLQEFIQRVEMMESRA